MRIIVMGGTKFIGSFIVDDPIAGGHDLLVHRGETEPEGGSSFRTSHRPDRLNEHGDALRLCLTESGA